MSEQLKPCPFCGSQKTEAQTDDGLFWVKCLGCYSTGPATTKYSGAEDNFYRDWNTRTAPKGCVVVPEELLKRIVAHADRPNQLTPGIGAPNHSHKVRGKWDRDGSHCDICADWDQLRALLSD